MDPKVGFHLLNSLVHSEIGPDKFRKLALSSNLFKGSEVELYKIIYDVFLRTGKLPHPKTLKKDHGIHIGKKVEEEPEYYYDRLQSRYIYMSLSQAFVQGAEHLSKDKPHVALEHIIRVTQDLVLGKAGNRIRDYAQDGYEIIWTEYLRQNDPDGVPSIPFGWPTLDEQAGRMRGGDLVTITGRPAAGKTYLGLYAALNAWNAGYVPLFVSMEMKPLLIAQRLTAMDVKCSVSNLMRGELATTKKDAMFTQLESNKSRNPFWIVDGSLTLNVDDLIAQTHQLKPDIVYVDGAYLMQSANAKLSRWERNAEVAERIKSKIAEDMDIPAVISYQMNRKAARKEGGSLDTIAYTDVIGQLSSIVLGLMQEDSIETAKHRKVSILKGRSGEQGEFEVNWIFDRHPFMDFTERDKTDPEDAEPLQFR